MEQEIIYGKCFIAISRVTQDTPLTQEKRIRDQFLADCEKYPKEDRELIIDRTGEHLKHYGKTEKTLNIKMASEPVDCKLVKTALDMYIDSHDIDTRRKGWKRHYSYIYKLYEEGLLGKVEINNGLDFLKECGFPSQKSNLYMYKPAGDYPRWKSNSAIKNSNEKTISEALAFALEFLDIYENLLKDNGMGNGMEE